MIRRLATFLLSAVLLLAAGPASAAPTLEEAAKIFGLPADSIARMLAGEVVAAPLKASNEKDLALAVAVRVNAPR